MCNGLLGHLLLWLDLLKLERMRVNKLSAKHRCMNLDASRLPSHERHRHHISWRKDLLVIHTWGYCPNTESNGNKKAFQQDAYYPLRWPLLVVSTSPEWGWVCQEGEYPIPCVLSHDACDVTCENITFPQLLLRAVIRWGNEILSEYSPGVRANTVLYTWSQIQCQLCVYMNKYVNQKGSLMAIKMSAGVTPEMNLRIHCHRSGSNQVKNPSWLWNPWHMLGIGGPTKRTDVYSVSCLPGPLLDS